ncbi:MAG: methylenetetrahydrofolate reductase [NAD(P)H] [Phascolarctobacterium sp.]|nr:MAG: methylenetetrahydrofolate reductase [NAD(P)H] [Phascolarctobacterium sp.]
MKISELLKSDKPCISCELFPPKAGSELQNALKIVDEIAVIKPHFISVTYGAGGTSAGQTVAIAKSVEEHNIPALAHLTCIDATEAKIDGMLANFRANGIQNVLALRGDAVTNGVRDFAHASDLMRKISASGDFCIGGACYPEGHPEAGSLDKDIEHTKKKIDAGCEFLVAQMCFDNNIMYNYMYRLLRNGIDVPVVAGIMPVTNAKQINRICELSGTKLPPHYRAIVERFADDPQALMQAGIAYALGQIIDLIANGFKNIHVYTMNKPEILRGIMKNLSEIVK